MSYKGKHPLIFVLLALVLVWIVVKTIFIVLMPWWLIPLILVVLIGYGLLKGWI